MNQETIDYLIEILFDDLGIDNAEAVEILARTIVKAANGDNALLELANEIIADA